MTLTIHKTYGQAKMSYGYTRDPLDDIPVFIHADQIIRACMGFTQSRHASFLTPRQHISRDSVYHQSKIRFHYQTIGLPPYYIGFLCRLLWSGLQKEVIPPTFIGLQLYGTDNLYAALSNLYPEFFVSHLIQRTTISSFLLQSHETFEFVREVYEQLSESQAVERVPKLSNFCVTYLGPSGTETKDPFTVAQELPVYPLYAVLQSAPLSSWLNESYPNDSRPLTSYDCIQIPITAAR